VTSHLRSRRRLRPFAGRARELDTAGASLAALLAGHGGVLLVAGEPGIGKTGLAEQVGSLEKEANQTYSAGRWAMGAFPPE